MQLDYPSLLSNIRDGVYFTDKDRRITFWNKGAERITGYFASEVMGHKCADNILVHMDESGRSLCHGRCPLDASMKDSTPREAKIFLHHKQGHRIPVMVRTTPLTDGDGHVVGGAEFFTDISRQELMRDRIKELEQLALLDPLTQLSNRHHIEAELQSRFHEMSRLGLAFGLFFMDVDHFKQINDTYGHDVGDQTLLTVANTLRASIRPFDLLGRWGGEEFLCVARSVDSQKLERIANRMRVLVGKSVTHADNQRIRVTLSVGATMALASDTNDSLVRRADDLMYNSKQKGRNRVTMG